jgi:hypothetical protein
MEHLPQLVLSVSKLTQAALQAVCPAPQTNAQVPFEQTCPLAHCVPQVPQLATLLAVSTHWALHNAGELPTVQVQVPLMHS